MPSSRLMLVTEVKVLVVLFLPYRELCRVESKEAFLRCCGFLGMVGSTCLVILLDVWAEGAVLWLLDMYLWIAQCLVILLNVGADGAVWWLLDMYLRIMPALWLLDVLLGIPMFSNFT